MKRKLALLGATGSIGTNTLDVINAYSDYFDVVLLSAHRDIDKLAEIAKSFPSALLAVTDEKLINKDTRIHYWGPSGLLEAIRDCSADMVVNGIAGAAGLLPSITALESGADLALANKETIVMAGPLVFSIAKKNHRRIIPVDSEHSAVFQLLEAHGSDAMEEIILTASGGPFHQYSREQLQRVTLRDALAHPTWNMGGKITIDSASLANKGLEVIEAVRLFSLRPEQVTVLVHPQSIVHSLVRLKDGSLYAQLSKPDMRLPIHNALFWPEVKPNQFGRLSLENQNLSFEKPKTDLFPLLSLAYKVAKLGTGYPVTFNAANEEAVAAFISGRISFMDISRIVETVLQFDWSCDDRELQSILGVDTKARNVVQGIIKEFSH